jgi:hypothetical protein
MMDILSWGQGENWPAYKHERLYAMVRTEADGVHVLDATREEMNQFTALMEESVADVEQALAEAGVSWQGLAAESMNAGVSPLAQWARDAATAAQASGDSVSRVGESFSYVANAMPEPVPTPSKVMTFPPTPADLAAAQVDQDATERAAQEAKQRAVDLMDTYSGNSATAVDTLGAFVPPQGVTVAVPAPPGGSVSATDGIIVGPADNDNDNDKDVRDGGTDDSGGPTAQDGDPASTERQPGTVLPPGGSSGTDPSQVTSPATTPVNRVPVAPPTTTPVTSPVIPFAPVPTGRFTDRDRAPGGGSTRVPGGGRGPGGGPGGVPGGGAREPGGGTGRGPAGTPGRGGMVGAGPMGAGEPVAGARGGAAGRPGMGAGGFGPMGGGQRGEEDKERTAPEFLRDYHDGFWDDSPLVAPPVIGEDDDD